MAVGAFARFDSWNLVSTHTALIVHKNVEQVSGKTAGTKVRNSNIKRALIRHATLTTVQKTTIHRIQGTPISGTQVDLKKLRRLGVRPQPITVLVLGNTTAEG